jgi:parallel beta-helix repeat protein
MKRELLVVISLAFLVVSLAQEIPMGQAQTPVQITIKSDGSIEPSTNAIQNEGNRYFLTADLNASIIIEKGGIVFESSNYTLQGPGASQNLIAITLMATNVTVKGFRFSGWRAGVYGAYENNTVTNNVFTDNYQAIALYAAQYILSKNVISESSTAILIDSGALRSQGDNNLITQNQISNNNWAIDILNSNGTTITQNNITNNQVILTLGILTADLHSAGFHQLHLNNFVDNKKVLHIPFGGPFASTATTLSPAGQWDNGTVGNYWSDYLDRYPNATQIDNSGIGNKPYIIEDTTTWSSDYANGTHLEGTTILGAAIDQHPLINPFSTSNSLRPAQANTPTQTSNPTNLKPTTKPTTQQSSKPTITPTSRTTQIPTTQPTEIQQPTYSNTSEARSSFSQNNALLLIAAIFLALCASIITIILVLTRNKK